MYENPIIWVPLDPGSSSVEPGRALATYRSILSLKIKGHMCLWEDQCGAKIAGVNRKSFFIPPEENRERNQS
jgi:hypothetical protein